MAEVIRPKPKDKEDFETALARLKQLQELHAETAIWRTEAKYHIEPDIPYLPLVPLSDIHIGSLSMDMEAFAEYVDYIKNYPVYTVMLGDLADMFMPARHPSGMLSDSITPNEQMITVRKLFEYLGKDKILGVVEDPSHVGWAMTQAGIDAYNWITMDMDIPLLVGGSMLDITVGSKMERYRTLLFHAIDRYNSSLNQTNAGKRALQLHRDADVVISGHRHIYSQEKTVMREKKVQVVQLGSFKSKTDRFGTSRGMFPEVQVGFPTLFYDTRKHNIEIVEDIDTAKEFIDAMLLMTRARAVATIHNARNAKT